MLTPNYPSIAKFQQLVELKDYRPPTQQEQVRYVRKLAVHVQCDPATLTENQVCDYFLFLRQHKHYTRTPTRRPNMRCAAFTWSASKSRAGPCSKRSASPPPWSCP